MSDYDKGFTDGKHSANRRIRSITRENMHLRQRLQELEQQLFTEEKSDRLTIYERQLRRLESDFYSFKWRVENPPEKMDEFRDWSQKRI